MKLNVLITESTGGTPTFMLMATKVIRSAAMFALSSFSQVYLSGAAGSPLEVNNFTR